MNKPYDEQVSALLDDEVAGGEMDLLLKRFHEDESLAPRIGRYAMIRDALHRNLPPTVGGDLASRVSAAIAEESAHGQDVRRVQSSRWMRAVSGMAVAASVAMLAVVVWPTQQAEVETSGSTPVAQSTPTEQSIRSSTVAGAQTVGSDEIRWDRLDPDVQARLSGYAVTRGDQPSNRQLGIVPRQVGNPGVSGQ